MSLRQDIFGYIDGLQPTLALGLREDYQSTYGFGCDQDI